MALDEARLLAFANAASALPLGDIVAAAQDPTNLGKVAAVIEDIIAALPAPRSRASPPISRSAASSAPTAGRMD
jgi:hypothetical protein